MIADPRTYTLIFRDDVTGIAFSYANGTMYFNVADAGGFPAHPVEPFPEATTIGELLIHELAEVECALGGGAPATCHSGPATDAQNAHRLNQNQGTTHEPNFFLDNQTIVWSYEEAHTRFPFPHGPVQHFLFPYFSP